MDMIKCIRSILGLSEKRQKTRCRYCGKTVSMALLYDVDGLCRRCLLEIVKLPGVLGEGKDSI